MMFSPAVANGISNRHLRGIVTTVMIVEDDAAFLNRFCKIVAADRDCTSASGRPREWPIRTERPIQFFALDLMLNLGCRRSTPN
jgi:hypothetical protein